MLDKSKLSRDYEKEPLGSWEDIPEQDLRYLYCDSGMTKTDICKYLPCCTAKLYRLVKKYNIHKKVQGVDPALLVKVDWSRLRRNYIEEPLKWREMPTKEEVAYLYIELEFSKVDLSRFFGRGDSERFAQSLLTKYQIRLPKEIATRHIADAYKAKTGYNSPLADPAVHKKARETCLKRYGAISWMKTEEAKKAQGVIFNTPEIIEHAKIVRAKTNLSRYGVLHTGQLPEVRERRRRTCLEKYNAESYPQSLVPPESLEILNTKEAVIQLFMEYPEYNTIKLGKLLGVSGETLRRRLQQFDLLFFIQQPTSSFERELKQLFPTVELRKDRTVLDGKEIDLYAPEFKIGIEFNGLCQKFLVGNLAAEVVGVEHIVSLKTVMACITFHIHDCIYADSMCVGSCTCSYHDKFTADILPDIFVALVHIHRRALHLGYVYVGIVYRVDQISVTVEKGESWSKFLAESHKRIFKTHLFHKKLCGLHSFGTSRNRQCET